MNLTGGVSVPSDVRQVTYACPENKDPESKEATFNVEAEIVGSDTIRACEDTTYYVKASFTSHDANEREICRLDDIEWTSEYVGDATGSLNQYLVDSPSKAAIFLNSRPDTKYPANILLTVKLTFQDLINSVPFEKEIKREILGEGFTFGCGLTCVEECFDDDPQQKVHKTALDFDIFGDGLLVSEPAEESCDCPTIDVGLGCGLKFENECPVAPGDTPRQVIAVDLNAIAGAGLTVEPGNGDCPCPKLTASGAYTAGCGIDISAGNVISVDIDEIAESGDYEWNEPESPGLRCQSTVLTTCVATTTPNLQDALNKLAILQGRVKFAYPDDNPENCPFLFSEVHLPHGCSLKVTDSVLELNFDMFKNGLRIYKENEAETCWSIGVCAEELDSPINVASCSQFLSDNLTECGSNTPKALAYGEVYRSTDEPPLDATCQRLVTKTVIPLGCYLEVQDGKLNVNFDDLETVTPTTAMFVLGYNPNATGVCKLVKFAITDCPT
jgi:hypothetical protein